MTNRKKLDEIENLFSQPKQEPETQVSDLRKEEGELPARDVTTPNSLTSSLKLPKKKQEKIRFTLDLEKPLDERLQKAANRLNRAKAEIARIALERLLNDLETEWKQ
jgi:hypothetical protein